MGGLKEVVLQLQQPNNLVSVIDFLYQSHDGKNMAMMFTEENTVVMGRNQTITPAFLLTVPK